METKQKLFDRLIDESLPMFRKAAYGILGNAADADDAVQEALILSWRKYSIFRSGGKLSSWVCRIVINVSYDMLRKKQRENKALENLPENDRSGSKDEIMESLQEAIAELPEPYRTALITGFLSDMSGAEAAEKLNCNLNTLYWYISRAKDMLRKKLRGA